jgi:hypothetical protein
VEVAVVITSAVVEQVEELISNTPYLFAQDRHFRSALVQEERKAQRAETQFFMWAIQSLMQREALVAELGRAFKLVVHEVAILPVELVAVPVELVDKVVLVQTTPALLHVMVAPA